MKLKLLRLLAMAIKLSTYGLVVQVFFMSVIYAYNGNAQYKSAQKIIINESVNGLSIKEAFDLIEANSDFDMLYLKKDLNKRVKISLNPESGRTVYDLLMEISRQSGLKFRQVNNGISASPIDRQLSNNELDRVAIIDAIDITGKVTDENGDGLPGASVLVKGTANGTTTDIEGNYKLSAPEDAVLTISFVGYATQEINLGGRSVIDVQMKLDAEQLQEVVVVGYGTVQKSDLTGAISSVQAEDLPLSANTSIGQALAAKAPGLVITQGSNQPGGATNVLIRGRASVGAGNTPLYVIDGFPIGGGSIEPGGGIRYGNAGSRDPLNSINPNDIESIEILKDASSTAIYGARAANGVILITTKRGKSGAPTVDYSGNYTFQKTAKWLDLLDAQEYMTVRNELLEERGASAAYTADQINNAGAWYQLVR